MAHTKCHVRGSFKNNEPNNAEKSGVMHPAKDKKVVEYFFNKKPYKL